MVRVGPPPPGATRGLGVTAILLSTTGIRLATAVVNDRQRRRSEVYSPECVEGVFSEVPLVSTSSVAAYTTENAEHQEQEAE